MKVSCIIPAYNEEKSIIKTLDTIAPLLDSDLFEILVINDHSSDKTALLLDNYPPLPNLHIIHNSKNLGKSHSVAKGIKSSKGDFILLLDADLLHLTAQNILDLITPIKSWKTWTSIAFIKNSRPHRLLQRAKSYSFFSPHATYLKNRKTTLIWTRNFSQ